jgi:phosphomannomutase
VLDGLPTSFSTPELNVTCAEGEPHRVVAELVKTVKFDAPAEGLHHRRRARRLARRLRPRARIEHHAGAGAALRRPHRGGAASHRGDMLALLKTVKPDAQLAEAAH